MNDQPSITMEQVLTAISQTNSIASTALQSLSGGRKKDVKLDTFDGKESSNFLQWSFHVDMTLKSVDLKPPHSLYAIMGALRGQALDIARNLQNQIYTYESNATFLAALKILFVSPAHKHQARAQYEQRVQGKGESIKVFHGLLQQLHNDAFDIEDRREPDIINHFVAGLRDRSLRLNVHNLNVIGHFPDTYSKVLDICLYYMAEKERVDIETLRLNTGNPIVQKTTSHISNGVEPMEIGSCRIHKEASHSDSECFTQKQRSKKTIGIVANNTSQTKHFATKNFAKKTDVCKRCKKTGHWANTCRVNLDKQKADNNQVNSLAHSSGN
jgi:hypothetical protein